MRHAARSRYNGIKQEHRFLHISDINMELRMNSKRLLVVAALLGGATLAGCGGGGGATPLIPGATPTPPSSIPSQSTMNSLTAYTVYQGTLGGSTFMEVMPLNVAPGTLQNAQPVPGAIVQYPDGSAQVADVLGNFDASQSSWAQTNMNAILSNPNLEPEVIAFDPGTSIIPSDAYVQVYSGSNSPVTASRFVSAQGSATSATTELASVTVFPRGYALYDGESRTYHAVGIDSSGSLTSLAGSSISWSVAAPQGCANQNGAGKVTADPNDSTRAVYTPPASGTFPSGCQDEVVATVAQNGASLSGSGNAFYYDPSTAVTLQGQLADSAGKAVARGIVDLYGGGREFYHGKLFAIADANGNFKTLVPSSRTLYPFAGNPVTVGSKTSYTFFTVNPATVAVGGAGSTVTQNLQETALRAANPFKALPPIARSIRDSWMIADIGQDGLPFGGAQSGGTFANGSLEAIINSPGPANSTGTVTSGAFKNWTFAWDSSGTVVVFQQPASQENGRHVLQIAVAGPTMQYGGACPSGDSCFNFIQYYNPSGIPAGQSSPLSNANLGSGTILTADGSFAQSVNSSQFAIAMTRNAYSTGHQTAGAPLYTHVATYQQTPGSLTVSVSDTWTDAAGKKLATFSGSRTQGSGSVLFTYSGTGTRTLYKPDGSQLAQVAFSLANGVLNADRSGGFQVTYTSGLPNASDNGTSVTWTLNASGSPRATGVVDNPNVTGLQSGHVATFSLAPTRIVTVTMDLNLGGNVLGFHL